MKEAGLLLQYEPPGSADIINTLDGSEGYFIPARLGTMGIAYNTDLISTAPAAWQDLCGEAFRDGFAIADPTASGTAMMAVVLLHEAFGEGFFHELRANGAYIGGGSSQVVRAVADGEATACLAVDYITFDLRASGSPIAIAFPPELIVIPSPVAIFRDSPNEAAAKLFASYLITVEAQLIIAASGTLPALADMSMSGEYNLPTVSEAMTRAIDIDDADMMNWKDGVVAAFMAVFQ